MTEAQLIERDGVSHIGEEVLRAIRDIKASRAGCVFHVEVIRTAEARLGPGLSQADFAAMPGVSLRRLKD